MSTFDIEHIDGHTVTVTQSDHCDNGQCAACPACDCACHWLNALVNGEVDQIVSPSGRVWTINR